MKARYLVILNNGIYVTCYFNNAIGKGLAADMLAAYNAAGCNASIAYA